MAKAKKAAAKKTPAKKVEKPTPVVEQGAETAGQ